MSKESSSAKSGGVGVFGLLGVVFVTLQLVGIAPVAAWSWWWVTAPFWGGMAIALAVGVIYLLACLIVAIFKK